MFGIIKRTWIVEEAAFPTHKQYTAYEIKKLFGIVVSKELLYENGLISGEASENEGLFSACTFLSPISALEAINLRKQALRISVVNPIKKILWEVE